MKKDILSILRENVENEPYAKSFNMEVAELREGYSRIRMKTSKKHENIHSITHGGAVFSLIDVAFGAAANSYGTIAVALNMNINYMRPAVIGSILEAEAREVNRGRNIAIYDVMVKNEQGKAIASCQAVAFLKKEKLAFLI